MTINLQILASEDDEIIGEMRYFSKVLTIGSSLQAGLFIKDDKLHDIHIKLESDASGLLIKSVNESEYILNNVRMVGEYRLSEKDRIAIGTTLMQVVKIEKWQDVSSDPAKVKGVGRIILEQLQKELSS